MFVPFENIANVSLGYKSLQNNFFYVNSATIDSFGIEKQFLVPILKLNNMNVIRYIQKPAVDLWLFHCREKKADIRKSGALRYIEAMAAKSAAEKKQTGKSLTIQEVLTAQSGGLWYAPKARLHRHHVWLRKAIGGVFSPFLFKEAALVDQRCNSVSPVKGAEWEEIAAVLTTTLFTYSVEINGSASMGAGALEAPTTKVREYPVLDIFSLKNAERRKLVSLARDVWKSEKSIDWSDVGDQPGGALQTLDRWVIDLLGRNVKLKSVYSDLHEVCRSRVIVAKDKVKKTKKKKTENISNVAEAISKALMPKLKSMEFPDDFVDGVDLDIDIHISHDQVAAIYISQLLDEYDIEVVDKNQNIIFNSAYARPVGEAIVRAILWGRSSFKVSSNRNAMDRSVNKFIAWVSTIESEIGRSIAESALGTGYEALLRQEVYAKLGIHHAAGLPTLPTSLSLSHDKKIGDFGIVSR